MLLSMELQRVGHDLVTEQQTNRSFTMCISFRLQQSDSVTYIYVCVCVCICVHVCVCIHTPIFPSPGYCPNPGIKPGSPALQADSFLSFSDSVVHTYICMCINRHIYIYLFFFRFFSLIGYCKTLTRIPCLIQV